MDHVAIMRKSWKLTDKILTGEKTIESRWYRTRYPPWGRIERGDSVYFKDSGGPVRIMADVEKVLQFSDLTPRKVKEILDEYWEADGISRDDVPKFYKMFRGKRYCILVFLRNARPVEPFVVDKAGFGAMASWISVDDVGKLRAGVGRL